MYSFICIVKIVILSQIVLQMEKHTSILFEMSILHYMLHHVTCTMAIPKVMSISWITQICTTYGRTIGKINRNIHPLQYEYRSSAFTPVAVTQSTVTKWLSTMYRFTNLQ